MEDKWPERHSKGSFSLTTIVRVEMRINWEKRKTIFFI